MVAEDYFKTLEYGSKPEEFKKLCGDKYSKICYKLKDLNKKKELTVKIKEQKSQLTK